MIKYRIELMKKSNKGNTSRDICFISDGKMVTRHGNPADTFRIWKEKRANKEDVSYQKGILLERFKDKDAKEIREHVEAELKLLQTKMGKDMEIVWRVINV
jgi:hypothetical protein